MFRKNDISARYRREAPISRQIIVATRRFHVRYITEISPRYRRNIVGTKRDIQRLSFALLLHSTVCIMDSESFSSAGPVYVFKELEEKRYSFMIMCSSEKKNYSTVACANLTNQQKGFSRTDYLRITFFSALTSNIGVLVTNTAISF